MAEAFGADPQVAADVAWELSEIRSQTQSMGELVGSDSDGDVTGSALVAGALAEFFSESSDRRGRVDQLLERASGLLRALADGTAAVDQQLAGALEQPGESPSPGKLAVSEPAASLAEHPS